MSNQSATFVDDSASLISQQIGIEISRSRRTSGLCDQLLTQLNLAKTEWTSAWIEDQIHILRSQALSRARGTPSVFADLHPNSHTS